MSQINPTITESILSSRFEAALVYATQLHSHQLRKGTRIPYISHLLSVAALVLEDGGNEDEAIAALLHDAVEDQGGEPTQTEILQRFGERVVAIVDGCTDTDVIPKPPWRERKQGYLDHLRVADPGVVRVSLADKLHNARSTLRDLQHTGAEVWQRFKAGREGTLWFYRQLLVIYAERSQSPMVAELQQVVTAIESMAA
jgi:(p)ppGpp synthase/HD superfamily hydrolase